MWCVSRPFVDNFLRPIPRRLQQHGIRHEFDRRNEDGIGLTVELYCQYLACPHEPTDEYVRQVLRFQHAALGRGRVAGVFVAEDSVDSEIEKKTTTLCYECFNKTFVFKEKHTFS